MPTTYMPAVVTVKLDDQLPALPTDDAAVMYAPPPCGINRMVNRSSTSPLMLYAPAAKYIPTLRTYQLQNTQFWLVPPQLPLHEQHDGPTPADMLVGALLPSALLEQLPCPVQVAPASAFHSVMALHADVSYA